MINRSQLDTILVEGDYYWVRPSQKDEFEIAKCKKLGRNGSYFFFTNGSRMEVERVWEVEPLSCHKYPLTDAKNNKNTGIIQEDIKKYMEDPKALFASAGGSFKVIDFNNLSSVISNTKDDFLIFDNGGGKKFEIMFDRLVNEDGVETLYRVNDFTNHLLDNHKNWIFSYQANGVQVIVKPLGGGMSKHKPL